MTVAIRPLTPADAPARDAIILGLTSISPFPEGKGAGG